MSCHQAKVLAEQRPQRRPTSPNGQRPNGVVLYVRRKMSHCALSPGKLLPAEKLVLDTIHTRDHATTPMRDTEFVTRPPSLHHGIFRCGTEVDTTVAVSREHDVELFSYRVQLDGGDDPPKDSEQLLRASDRRRGRHLYEGHFAFLLRGLPTGRVVIARNSTLSTHRENSMPAALAAMRARSLVSDSTHAERMTRPSLWAITPVPHSPAPPATAPSPGHPTAARPPSPRPPPPTP